ncbi:MAG: MFS transporter, partial [Acidimicrobiia bacterium]|nr:MFS transporter [Acidimicrobiia bacterium]
MDELVPLYPVYALLFSQAGLSGGHISALLALWSITAFGLEIPSGALADRVSRRHLLAAAALLRTAGFVVWLVCPSFGGFAAGFVLWGAGGSFASGTWEALVYDELVALGVPEEYAKVVGRAEVASALAVIVATALAGPLVAAGGYEAAGWASVALGLVAAALPFLLPATAPAVSVEDEEEGGGVDGYVATLRAGLREAGRHGPVRRTVVVAAVLSGVTAVEEYVPLLTDGMALAPAAVPLVLLLPAVTTAVGAELAGRVDGLTPRRTAALVAGGA